MKILSNDFYLHDTYNYDLPSHGEYVFFPLQMGNGTYTISILENVSGKQV